MRHISFAHTTEQVRAGTKTVTRRYGWENARVGEYLQGIRQGQGIPKGGHVEKLRVIIVTGVRREPLQRLLQDPDYGRAEMVLEGFPGRDPANFINGYFRGRSADVLTRIEFVYAD